MNIQELTQKIMEKKKVASLSLDDYPRSARPAWETAIRQAKDELKSLSDEFMSTMVSSALVLFPSGTAESVTKFCSTAQKVADAFILDTDDFYHSVIDAAWDAFPRPGPFNLTQIGLVTSYFKTAVYDLIGAERIKTPDFHDAPFYNTRSDLFNYVKKAIRAVGGDEYNISSMLSALQSQILKNSFTKPTIPVIITNTSDVEGKSISSILLKLGAKAQRVENFIKLTEDLNEEMVMNLLGKVKNKAKK